MPELRETLGQLDPEALEWWFALPVAERARLTVRHKDRTPQYVRVASGQLYREMAASLGVAASEIAAALKLFTVSVTQAQKASQAFQVAARAKRSGGDEHRRLSMQKPTGKPWDR